MNNITIYGALGRDAEVKYSQASMPIITLNVADSVGYGDKKNTNWWNVVLLGNQFEKLAQYLVKGQSVIITGEVHYEQYEKKDGSKGSKLKLVGSKCQLVSKKESSAQPRGHMMPEQVPFEQDTLPYDDDDGDIPF
jgi:single-strand DNA-binding protein